MKNLLVFLFGATCGAVGMMFYLRKDIKKRLEAIEENARNSSENGKEEKKTDDVPFEMKDETSTAAAAAPVPEAMKESTAVNYNKIINDNGYRGSSPVPVRAEMNETYDVIEIDMDTFMHDKSCEKDRLVYFQGDRVMCTENGTIYPNPADIVGVAWEQSVGKYAERTAFIRNKRNLTDYEIYVEDGLYTDEYGDENNFRED